MFGRTTEQRCIYAVIFCSRIVVFLGLASIDFQKSGKMWIHCFTYYITTTFLATFIAITLVSVIQPGRRGLQASNVEKTQQQVVSTMDSFLDLFR